MRKLALLAVLLAGRAFSQNGILVQQATYGSNVPSIPPGNATAKVAGQCNGLFACSYTVWYYNFTPDPAPGKAKDFAVTWTCNSVPFFTTAVPLYQGVESGYGSIATLTCPTTTPTPTPPGPQVLKWKITYTCTPPFKSCMRDPWTNVVNYQITNPDSPGVTAKIEIVP